MDKDSRIITDGAVVVKDGRILDVDETDVIQKKYRGDFVIDAKGKAVIPGLINVHIHSGMLRGMGDDLELYRWLKEYIHPEHMALTAEDAYTASLLTYAESVKSGTTCVLDLYRFMHKSADAAEKVGIRANLAPSVSDKLDFYEKFEDNVKLVRERHNSCNGRIRIWFGFHNWRDNSSEQMAKIRESADRYKVGIHTHTSESVADIELARKLHGKRPIEHLEDCGITGPDVILAHCVWLTNKEIRILKSTGTHVAHCPVSNMKLADGVAPVQKLAENSVNVGLGTDGTVECNRFDMFAVMKTAAILQRVNELNGTIMSAEHALRMATINGAKALGMEKELGSIEPTKKADLLLINLQQLHFTPVFSGETSNILSHIVFAAHAEDVETVIIDGRIVVRDGVLATVNEEETITRAGQAAKQLFERRKMFIGKAALY